jgi:hypothetical protein
MPYELMSDDAIKYRYDGVRKLIENRNKKKNQRLLMRRSWLSKLFKSGPASKSKSKSKNI